MQQSPTPLPPISPRRRLPPLLDENGNPIPPPLDADGNPIPPPVFRNGSFIPSQRRFEPAPPPTQPLPPVTATQDKPADSAKSDNILLVVIVLTVALPLLLVIATLLLYKKIKKNNSYAHEGDFEWSQSDRSTDPYSSLQTVKSLGPYVQPVPPPRKSTTYSDVGSRNTAFYFDSMQQQPEVVSDNRVEETATTTMAPRKRQSSLAEHKMNASNTETNE
jgi:hypothetical protein